MFSISFSNRNFLLLLVFRTQDSSVIRELVREAHSRSTTGLELRSRGFLILRKFCKYFFEFDPLCHVATLDHNVVTLKESKNPSLCQVAMLDLNVAMLDPNVATLTNLILYRFQHARERHKVGF